MGPISVIAQLYRLTGNYISKVMSVAMENSNSGTIKKLRETERSLGVLINSSPDQIWLVDSELILMSANESFIATVKKIFGINIQLGQSIIFPGLCEDLKHKWRSIYNRALEGERFTIEYPDECSPILESGFFEMTFNPVFDEHRSVIGIGCFSKNVTQRKKAEAEIKSSNRKLHELAARLQSIREEERTHIAREIHDELGQQLTGLKFETFLIKKTIPIEDATNREKLSNLVVLINESIKAVERISTELRPGILDSLGLMAALKWQGREFEKRTGILFQFFSIHNDIKLEVNLSTNIFRVYQEALTNIARHANATKVSATLIWNDDYMSLIINDNGRGFNLNEAMTRNSLGLVGMKERSLMLNGHLTIKSSKRNGTTIILKVPFPDGDPSYDINRNHTKGIKVAQ